MSGKQIGLADWKQSAIRRMRRQPIGLSLLYLLSVFVLVFVVAPPIMVFLISINARGSVAFPPEGFTLEWYSLIPESMWSAGATSLVLAAITVLGALILGVPAAFGLVRGSFKFRGGFATGLRSPLTVPQVVIGVALFQYYASLSLGFELRGNLLGLSLAHIIVATPFVIVSMMSALEKFDRSVEEAAEGLGASAPSTLWRITLPLLKPSIFAASFFAFLISFDNVPISLFLTSGRTRTLPVEIFFAAGHILQPYVFAISSIVVLFAIAGTIVWDRYVGLRQDFNIR